MITRKGDGFITLDCFFKENPEVALGLSGGVDSSYLLCAALKAGAKVKAYFIKTAFQPEFELSDALRIAKELGADISVLEADVLGSALIASNPPERCYHCKKAIFGMICENARRDGIEMVIDGTNASDDPASRPGMKALAELKVRSPLRECGLTKSEIRRLSEAEGLFTSGKPAYACLATRIPSGREITAELLRRVEDAENALCALSFTGFRVRVLGDAAKLQFPRGQLERAFSQREAIISALKPYFSEILCDLEGRSHE